MAGYSGTPLPKKLGVKPGLSVRFVNIPNGVDSLLSCVSPSNNVNRSRRVDLTVSFHKSIASLNKSLPSLIKNMAADGMVWIAWPKKSSGVATDLTENVIREIGLAIGLVDVKVCAIDETWSGLKFVIPIKARANAGAKN